MLLPSSMPGVLHPERGVQGLALGGMTEPSLAGEKSAIHPLRIVEAPVAREVVLSGEAAAVAETCRGHYERLYALRMVVDDFKS